MDPVCRLADGNAAITLDSLGTTQCQGADQVIDLGTGTITVQQMVKRWNTNAKHERYHGKRDEQLKKCKAGAFPGAEMKNPVAADPGTTGL